MRTKSPAVLVATRNSLKESGGGVQRCTGDYLSLLRSDFELHIVDFNTDHRWRTRIANRVFGNGYRRQVPPTLAPRIEQVIERTGSDVVLFNLLDFPNEAQRLRSRFVNKVRLVHLSHGLASTDIAIAQRERRAASVAVDHLNRAMAAELGSRLQFEMDYRQHVDLSICLSPLDAELERWLGARRTCWFARAIREAALELQPIDGRIGCVATLDHPPNRSGLETFCAALQQFQTNGVTLRLVGSPEKIGRQLNNRFGFVQFLGALSDEDLRAEAATWCCFVHPLFSYARGCSMKIGVALGWGLPIVTTSAGSRGYIWDEHVAPLAADATVLAAMTIERSRAENFAQHVEQTRRVAAMQPNLDELATSVVAAIRTAAE